MSAFAASKSRRPPGAANGGTAMKFDNWGHKRPRSRFSQWCEWHGIEPWNDLKGFAIALAIIVFLSMAEGSLFFR